MLNKDNEYKKLAEHIRDYPHILGHLIGKTKLTMMHSDWIKYVWASKVHRALMGHRGSLKTTALTEIGPMWWLLWNPSDRIAIIRKPYTEAAKTLATIKNYFMLEEIQQIFYAIHGFAPKFKVKKEKSLVFNFKRNITKEGSIDAYGVDGAITGNHYDKILLDDFITLKDRISKAEREKTIESVREIITNIIDPGKQCMFVGTPWHKKDAWSVAPPAAMFDTDATGLLSPEEIAEKQRRTTSVLFAINYKLEHESEDDLTFTDPKIDRWDWKLKPVYAQLDAAFQGDHTTALTIVVQRPDKKFHAVGWVFEENVKDKFDWIVQKCEKYRVKYLFNEENPDKGYTGDEIAKRGIRVKKYHESMNKHIKISTHLKHAWDDIFWSPETQDEYMEQVTDYRKDQEPDDAPDSAASLFREAYYGKGRKNSLFEM